MRKSVVACEPAATPAPAAPGPAATTEPPSQTPFVVDDTERATELEVAARRGTVAIAYDTTRFVVLRDCTGHGQYGFVGTAPEPIKKVFVSLSAELPFKGKSLETSTESERARGATVTLLATAVGSYTLDHVPTRSELLGDCTHATHVVTSMMVGAFELAVDASGAKASLADSFRATPGPPPTSLRKLTTGGDNAACFGPDPHPPHPPVRCKELIRIAVAPLDP